MKRLRRAGPAPHGAGVSEQLLTARAVPVLRLLLLGTVLLANDLVAHPYVGTYYFNIVMAVALAYGVAILVGSWRHGKAFTPHGGRLTIDLLFFSALAFCSGRGFPQIRAVFIVAPILAALRLSPRRTAAMSLVTGVLYVLVALTHPVLAPLPVLSVLVHSLFVVWAGAAAVLISALRVRREQRIVALSQARGRLVAQTVDAEERARKQISGALHDDVVQDLLAARQDLAEAQAGDETAFTRVTHAIDLALCQLRSMIDDLDPYLLDYLDLPAALEAIANRAARHGDCIIEVNVEADSVGGHTELVASLARELLSNAAKHSGAACIRLGLRREGETLVLEVNDDGRGFTAEQALAAVRAGHIGLAASRERVEALGGSFELDSAPREGTRVRCLLPLAVRREEAHQLDYELARRFLRQEDSELVAATPSHRIAAQESGIAGPALLTPR